MSLQIEELAPYVSFEELEAILKTERRQVLFWDIETRPAELAVLKAFFDEDSIEMPKDPGKFDPLSVAYGNTKDPAKKAAKLKEVRTKHFAAAKSYKSDCAEARRKAWDKHVKRATLDACTGRVGAIGYGLKRDGETKLFLDVDDDFDNEHDLLKRLWEIVRLIKGRGGKMVTWNGNSFDIPFCTRRTWAHEGLKAVNLRTKYNKFDDSQIDAMNEWKLGAYGVGAGIKLDKAAKMMGVRRKLEGMDGSLWWSTYKEDPQRALDYLELDVLVLSDVAHRMNLV